MDFKQIFLYSYSVLLPLFVLVIPKGLLTMKIYKNCNGVSKIGIYGASQCFVPFYNSFVLRKALYGSARGIGLANTLFVLFTTITVLIRFIFPKVILLQLLFTLLMAIMLVMLYVIELIINWDLCNIFGCRGYKWLAVLFPPLCSYALSNKIDSYFKKNKDLIEGTFTGEV